MLEYTFLIDHSYLRIKMQHAPSLKILEKFDIKFLNFIIFSIILFNYQKIVLFEESNQYLILLPQFDQLWLSSWFIPLICSFLTFLFFFALACSRLIGSCEALIIWLLNILFDLHWFSLIIFIYVSKMGHIILCIYGY